MLGRQTSAPLVGPGAMTTTPPPASTTPATSTATSATATVTPQPAVVATRAHPATRTPEPSRPTATRTPPAHTALPTATSTLVPTVSGTAASAQPTSSVPTLAPVATAEAAISATVIQSNTAWTSAMENASPAGLATIKTGSNLQSNLKDVAALQNSGEHWQITLQDLQVVWARALSPTDAEALVHKTAEHRALYRKGSSTPLQTVDKSYTDVYHLRQVGGQWLVSLVTTVDDTTAQRLAASPPTSVTTAASGQSPNTATPLPAITSVGTETAVATSTPAPGETVAPANGDPIAVVRTFYASLTAHDYATAYALFTPRLQAAVGAESTWASQYAAEQSSLVKTASTIAHTLTSTTVSVTLQTTWATTAGTVATRNYSGTWGLVLQNGTWLLDAANIRSSS